jgi:ribosomal protein S18 acetylase RimI-like enzyme
VRRPSPAELNIRPASSEDVDLLLAIERQCFRAHRFTRKDFQYHLKNPRSILAVAEVEGEIAGYVAGIIYHGSRSRLGWLYSMAVLPAWRGRGFGSRLLKYFENEAAKAGSQAVVLEVRKTNRTAFSLYRKAGYEVSKKLLDYYAAGSDGLRMRKALS